MLYVYGRAESDHGRCRWVCGTCLGLARTIYIRCIYGIFGREFTKDTVIYGVYIRFWPTLHMLGIWRMFYESTNNLCAT